jgi:hypothetical protein
MALRYDYDLYIPYSVVVDLVEIWAVIKLKKEDELLRLYPPFNHYNKSLVELVSLFVDDRALLPNSGTEFAFELLKAISKTTNLRGLQSAKIHGSFIKRDETEEQQNYKFDLGLIDKEFLNYFGVEIPSGTDVNTIKLDDALVEILKFYTKISKLPGIDEKESSIIHRNMHQYGEVVKMTGKWRYKFPTFHNNLAKKKLPVKMPKYKYVNNSEVSLLIDVSLSTNTEKYKALVKTILLYYAFKFKDGTNIINLFYFGYDLYSIITVKSKQELFKIIEKGYSPIIDLKGWKYSLPLMIEKVKGEAVLLITDGLEDNIPPVIPTIPFHVISLNPNSTLLKLATTSGGKFLKL